MNRFTCFFPGPYLDVFALPFRSSAPRRPPAAEADDQGRPVVIETTRDREEVRERSCRLNAEEMMSLDIFRALRPDASFGLARRRSKDTAMREAAGNLQRCRDQAENVARILASRLSRNQENSTEHASGTTARGSAAGRSMRPSRDALVINRFEDASHLIIAKKERKYFCEILLICRNDRLNLVNRIKLPPHLVSIRGHVA